MAEFLAIERCDRCGAPALVETSHVNGVLLWCAHHAREHRVLDLMLATRVHPSLERERVAAK